jgi:hypothetical protein
MNVEGSFGELQTIRDCELILGEDRLYAVLSNPDLDIALHI